MNCLNPSLAVALAAAGLLTFTQPSAQAQLLTVDVYEGHAESGDGSPFSGLVGSFGADDIQFGASTGDDWHPFGLSEFGAQITGCIEVTSTGIYTFKLRSDDGSQLFIDGVSVVSNPDGHPPTEVSEAVALTPGIHEILVNFFEDFGGPSALDLTLPDGVSYVECPDDVPDGGSSFLLLGIASAFLLPGAKRLARR
jgi:hypothetical protein